MIRRPPSSPLFPYTTLFRSGWIAEAKALRILDGYNNQKHFDGFQCGDRKSTRLNSSHSQISSCLFFFFNDPATTELSPLPLHDALPIWVDRGGKSPPHPRRLQQPEALRRLSVRAAQDPDPHADGPPRDHRLHRHDVRGVAPRGSLGARPHAGEARQERERGPL